MTTTFTLEHGQVAVFIAVDHCSAECVGIHAALHGTRHEALEPVRQGVAERFGGVEKDAASGLSIRHDHGSQYMSHDFQKEIAAAWKPSLRYDPAPPAAAGGALSDRYHERCSSKLPRFLKKWGNSPARRRALAKCKAANLKFLAKERASSSRKLFSKSY